MNTLTPGTVAAYIIMFVALGALVVLFLFERDRRRRKATTPDEHERNAI